MNGYVSLCRMRMCIPIFCIDLVWLLRLYNSSKCTWFYVYSFSFRRNTFVNSLCFKEFLNFCLRCICLSLKNYVIIIIILAITGCQPGMTRSRLFWLDFLPLFWGISIWLHVPGFVIHEENTVAKLFFNENLTCANSEPFWSARARKPSYGLVRMKRGKA